MHISNHTMEGGDFSRMYMYIAVVIIRFTIHKLCVADLLSYCILIVM